MASITLSIHSFIKPFLSRALRQKRLWLLCTIISVLTIIDLPTTWGLDVTLAQAWSFIILFGVTKGTFLWLLFSPFDLNLFTKVLRGGVLAIVALVGLINVGSLGFYGFGITDKLTTIIGQTTWAEVSQFVPYTFMNLRTLATTIGFWLVIIVLIAAIWCIKYLRAKFFLPVILTATLMGVVVFLQITDGFTHSKTLVLMSVRLPRFINQAIEDQQMLRDFVNDLRPFPMEEDVSSKGMAANVVVVIGESANRNHHSIYGCKLPTTPVLDYLSGELFVFKKALASATNTAPNMERILTFKKDDGKDGDWYNYPNVIDLFNHAGYSTYWFSNQNQGGVCMDASAAIATHSNIRKYVGNTHFGSMQLFYDERLLPLLASTLKDRVKENKMIFLHLLGSHSQYDLRYPSEYNVFTREDVESVYSQPWFTPKKTNVLAEYLNTIRYTDYVLGEAIRMVKATSTPSILLYLSDHGECVYDEADYIARGKKHVEVPFILYMNDAYRRLNPEMVEKVKEALDRPFSTANTIHSLITLTGTEYPLYEAQEDVLSPKFIPRKRYVDRELWPYEESALPAPAW